MSSRVAPAVSTAKRCGHTLRGRPGETGGWCFLPGFVLLQLLRIDDGRDFVPKCRTPAPAFASDAK